MQLAIFIVWPNNKSNCWHVFSNSLFATRLDIQNQRKVLCTNPSELIPKRTSTWWPFGCKPMKSKDSIVLPPEHISKIFQQIYSWWDPNHHRNLPLFTIIQPIGLVCMDIGTRTNEQHDRKYKTFKVEQGTLDPDEFEQKMSRFNLPSRPNIFSSCWHHAMIRRRICKPWWLVRGLTSTNTHGKSIPRCINEGGWNYKELAKAVEKPSKQVSWSELFG